MLVDTNVLLDVLEDDPSWADWSLHQLRTQSQLHRLAINPIVYAELSLAFSHVEALDAALQTMELAVLELPRPALFLAGKAFAQYRRRGGVKSNVLSDFSSVLMPRWPGFRSSPAIRRAIAATSPRWN